MTSRYYLWPGHDHGGEFNAGMLYQGFRGCERAGGCYVIGLDAADMLRAPRGTLLSDADQAKLRSRVTTMLVDLRKSGETCPEVTRTLVEEAFWKQPLPVHERADRLLRFLSDRTQIVGEYVEVSPEKCDEACAWSESIEWREVHFLLSYLAERGWIQVGTLAGNMFKGWVTVEGYSRIEETEVNADSAQAFVAMWFDPSMAEAFDRGIKPAIERSGYIPFKINEKPDVDKIDDEIIGEIRRSRFVVADFTHGDTGARGGVYYEAGFAYGLGLHVIRSCRKDIIDNNELHFDVRQHYHVVWETPEQLREGVEQRVRALIGEGPNVER